MTCHAKILLSLSLLAWPCAARGADAPTKQVYPGKTWARKAPAEVGMAPAPLAELAKVAGGRGCVVRGGYMVFTWGDAAKRGDVASAAKPWYSHFLLLALETGKIPSLDEKVVKHQPALAKLNKALGHKDRLITWRHLANQTSCYGLREKPGVAFAYNDWQMALFWDMLFLKVYRATYQNVDEKVVRPLLADPIGCEDKPTFTAFGPRNRAGRAAVSPRDFARFGLLYLREGNWRGKQLLSAKLARLAVTSPLPANLPRAGKKAADMLPGQRSIGSRNIPDNQCDHLGSYSWLWWVNGLDARGKRHWPHVPAGAYGAFGHGGKRAMVVVGSMDLIISWNDTRIRGAEMENRVLGLLVRSAGWKPSRPRR
jgi:CubicO group peptidase (beta-lactamase class C family)